LFAAVNLLTSRYGSYWAAQPEGEAIVKAVIDWQRAGMPPGSITEATLQALAEITLARINPQHELNGQAFTDGLTWAMHEVAPAAALVLRVPAGRDLGRRYRAFDGVVSWARENDGALSAATWDFVINRASDADLQGVGLAASSSSVPDIAVTAFQRAADSADPLVAARAGFSQGVVLGQQGRHEQAAAAFERAAQRHGDGDELRITELAAASLSNLGNELAKIGRYDQAMAACEQMVQRYGVRDEASIAVWVASALADQAFALVRQKLWEQALAAFKRVAVSYGDRPEPEIVQMVAQALVSQGNVLGVLEQYEQAEAVFEQAVARYGDRHEPDIAELVAQALVGQGRVLAVLKRNTEAAAVYQQLVQRTGKDSAPAAELAEALSGYGLEP
jgi:tetratricopeptide (TPR) repeat protein